MQTKDFGLSVKDVSEEGTFEGYASTFGGSPDSYGDIVSPGAFADSLAKHRREGTMPLMFFGHKHNELTIGSWTDLAEDGKGLWGKGQLDLEDPFAARVHRKLRRKEMRGLSIGYRTIAAEPDRKRPGVQFLKSLDLFEVSVVNNPANKRSLVNDVKSDDRIQAIYEALSAGGMPTERQLGKALQALGFPNAKAEALATACKPILVGEPEAKADELDRFLKALRS